METIMFKPNPRHTALWKIVGLFAAGAGGIFVCVFGFIAVFTMMIGMPTTDAPGSSPLLPVALMLGAGVCVGGLFIVIGLLFLFSRSKEQLTLTPEALIISTGKAETRLPLAEITALQAVRRASANVGSSSPPHWAARIESRFEKPVELDISGARFLAQFDMQPVLQKLLPRLPAEAEIDQRLQTYIETGKIS